MITALAIIIPLLAGGVLTWFLKHREFRNYRGDRLSITGPEFLAVGALVVGASLLITMVFGPSAARAKAASGYNEFLNGSVVEVREETINCTRDGPCQREYNCDPYVVIETYTATDSKGNVTTHTRPVTRYHDCPYATREYTYLLSDSLGRTITLANHIFGLQPKPWRVGVAFPNVPRGRPERWLRARAALQVGDAEPVTMVNGYVNYILPSENDVLRQHSASIKRYQRAKLLPQHTANLDRRPLYDYDTQATKVQFVGGVARDSSWNDRLAHFNAALGSERQGDLHIVVAPAAQVSNPDEYIGALTAFWVSKLGKWGLPKNAIALAIGVDGKKIAWARAKTGMPVGNNEMLTAISLQLKDKPYDPDVVLGKVRAEVSRKAPRYVHGKGVLDRIMFVESPFKRACMRCKDKGDNGTGFVYLEDSIPVSGVASFLMILVVLVLSAALWLAAVRFDPFASLVNKAGKEPE